MPARKFRAVATSMVLVGAASLSAMAATAPAHAAQATDPVMVSIGKARVISMPETLQPGVTEFHVMTAAKRSDFQLAMPAAGYTAEDASRDIEKGLERGKIPQLKRFEKNVTLYGGVAATSDRDASLLVTLTPGTYWAIDVNTNDPDKFFEFTVAAGPDTGNALPESVTLKAKGSTKFARSPKSIPNKGMLTFKNASDQNHFLSMIRLKKGMDIKDFKKWLLAPDGPAGPPPVDFSKTWDSGVISPGVSMTADYKLPKGNYVMICFWPDASMGGMPHAFMGMFREIKLK
jgi:hypothetical protein